MIISANPSELQKLKSETETVRQGAGFDAPVVSVDAGKLTTKDWARLGLSREWLPLIGMVRFAADGRMEAIAQCPTPIIRNVENGQLAAQLAWARWADLKGKPCPGQLAKVRDIFEPGRVVAFAISDDLATREAITRALTDLSSKHRVSEATLPIVGTPALGGLLSAKEMERLGFSAAAQPCTALIEMSDLGYPTKVVGNGIVRKCKDPLYSATQVLRAFSSSRNLGLAIEDVPLPEELRIIHTAIQIGPGPANSAAPATVVGSGTEPTVVGSGTGPTVVGAPIQGTQSPTIVGAPGVPLAYTGIMRFAPGQYRLEGTAPPGSPVSARIEIEGLVDATYQAFSEPTGHFNVMMLVKPQAITNARITLRHEKAPGTVRFDVTLVP